MAARCAKRSGGVRHRRPRAPRSQSGSALVLVLIFIVIFALGAIAIAAFTTTASKSAVRLASYHDTTRTVDGVLESAVNDYRGDSTAVNQNCSTRWTARPSWLPAAYAKVTCSNAGNFSATARTAIIEVTRGSTVVGRAKVKVSDTTKTGAALPGAFVTVCDWQLADATATPVNSCS